MQPGFMFEGRYRIEGLLGEGGFSNVYAAVDDGSSRRVALKVLKPDPKSGAVEPLTRARFLREVRVVASLRDAHSVRLFDHGETAAGLPYIVFEHVPGEDLSTILERYGALDSLVVRHLLVQLLGALGEAHQAGMLHRDLKPQNIRVFEYDNDPWFVKLLDFGIARSSDHGSPSLTKTGELVGTPRYMSPEQLLGKPLTAASDIYSLGMVVFELLLGPQALAGNTWGAQLDRVAGSGMFAAPGTEHIDADLMRIVRRMTQREVDDRYPSTTAVLRDLVGQTAVVVLPEASNTPPISRRLVAGSAALIVVVLAVVCFATLYTAADDVPPAIPPPQRLNSNPLVKSTTADVDAAQPGLADATDTRDAPSPDAGTGHAGYDGPESLGCGAMAHSMSGLDVFRPRNYDPDTPYPLLILLHSDYQEPRAFARNTGFQALVDSTPLVLLAPDDFRLGVSWRGGETDMQRVRNEAMRVMDSACIDRRRVYVVGNGDGARIAWWLACEPWVTAVAMNGHGHTAVDPMPTCEPTTPIMWLTPTKSPHIPIDGRPNCGGKIKLTPQEIDEHWKQQNHCRGPKQPWFSHLESRCHTWTCDTPYVSCLLDGGRDWPGTAPATGLKCPPDSSSQFPTTDQVWRFLSNTPLLDLPTKP